MTYNWRHCWALSENWGGWGRKGKRCWLSFFYRGIHLIYFCWLLRIMCLYCLFLDYLCMTFFSINWDGMFCWFEQVLVIDHADVISMQVHHVINIFGINSLLIFSPSSTKSTSISFLISFSFLLKKKMQNWSHVNSVVEQLNRIPSKQHGTDIMRIRQWYVLISLDVI